MNQPVFAAWNKYEEDLEIFTKRFLEGELKNRCFQKIMDLQVYYSASKEPVCFEKVPELTFTPIEIGDVWARENFACAWFKLTGKLPADLEYTAEIFNTPAREAAYDVMRTLLMQQNGYTKLESNFQKMQKSFIKGTSIFSSNGEWIENEVSAELNPGDANIQYLRIPVISSIVNNPTVSADFTGTDAEKDAKLSAVIDYIDTHSLQTATAEAASELAVSETTLQLLIDARLFQYCTPSFAALVPAYSDQIPAAKEFLKFMLSKEGQEIFMASTYGVCAPLNVDMTQFDYYANATTLGKSKMDLLQNSLLIGDESNTYPMQYVSDGIRATRMDIVNKFAGSSAADAKSVMNEEYNYYLTVWKDLMTAAGVSN